MAGSGDAGAENASPARGIGLHVRLRLRPCSGDATLGRKDDRTVCVKPLGEGGGLMCSDDRMWRALALRLWTRCVCASRWQQTARNCVLGPLSGATDQETAQAPLLPACMMGAVCQLDAVQAAPLLLLAAHCIVHSSIKALHMPVIPGVWWKQVVQESDRAHLVAHATRDSAHLHISEPWQYA